MNDFERDVVEEIIGRKLDEPSLYMGGASPPSRRKAREIIEQLERMGVELVTTEEFYRAD